MKRSGRSDNEHRGCNLPPQAARLAPTLRALADRGVYFGTSSWKYDGWLGSIYSQDRYMTRGKLSNAKFEENCLAEYAETFPTVCGDLTFYQFPSEQYWANLFDAAGSHVAMALGEASQPREDLTGEPELSPDLLHRSCTH